MDDIAQVTAYSKLTGTDSDIKTYICEIAWNTYDETSSVTYNIIVDGAGSPSAPMIKCDLCAYVIECNQMRPM